MTSTKFLAFLPSSPLVIILARFLAATRYEYAALGMIFGFLSFFFRKICPIQPFRGQRGTGTWVIEATEFIWVHLRLFRGRWDSWEAVWRLFGGKRSLNRGRKHNRELLATCGSCLSKGRKHNRGLLAAWLLVQSCLSKASYWKAFHKVHLIAPHAYLLLPCSPQVLQGHCPLVRSSLT